MRLSHNDVFLGATQYAGGVPVALDKLINDPARWAALREAIEGVESIPVCDGDILEKAHTAVKESLRQAQREAAEIDAVFLVSNGLDARNGLETAWLGNFSEQLGLEYAAHYPIAMAGCAGFHWAIKPASSLIAAGDYHHVLLLSFDQASPPLQRIYGEGTDFPYLTGDVAAACILSDSPRQMDFRLQGPVNALWDGRQAQRASLDDEIESIERLFSQAYAGTKVDATDIHLFITNNYSLNVSRLYSHLSGIDFEKTYTGTIASHAHCFASDIVVNLHHSQHSGLIQAGQRVMTFSAGPNQWGTCIFEKIEPGQEAE